MLQEGLMLAMASKGNGGARGGGGRKCYANKAAEHPKPALQPLLKVGGKERLFSEARNVSQR